MKRLVVLISVCCCVLLMQASIHNVKDYGARADGVTIDSPAISRAISAAAGEGGGTNRIYPCRRICLLFHTACQPCSSLFGTGCAHHSGIAYSGGWI